MDDFISAVNDVLRYSHESIETMGRLLNAPEQMTHRFGHDDPLGGLRGVFADLMDENDRPDEAKLLRDKNTHVYFRDGRVVDAGPPVTKETFDDVAAPHAAAANRTGGRKGWGMGRERTGAWVWDHPDRDFYIYASPFWDGSDGIQIEVTHPNGDLEHHSVPFDLTGSLHEDVEAYHRAVDPFLT